MSNSDFEPLENNNTFINILGDTDYYRLRPGELCFTFPIHVWNAALNNNSTNSMTTQSANSNVSMNETILDSNGLPSDFFGKKWTENLEYAIEYDISVINNQIRSKEENKVREVAEVNAYLANTIDPNDMEDF